MKVFIVLSSMFAIAVANYYAGSYGHAPLLLAPTAKVIHSAPVHTGHSSSSRSQDSWGNYKFSYGWQGGDAWYPGGASQTESGDSWNNKHGSYSLNVGDGRVRKVSYVADAHGFRAKIDTNEPGVAAKAPADVSISTPHGYAPAAHGYSHAAPLYAAAAYPAHAYAPAAYGHY